MTAQPAVMGVTPQKKVLSSPQAPNILRWRAARDRGTVPGPKAAKGGRMAIQHPYLMFLGDARDPLAAKTAQGVADWRPDWCLGQLRLPDCNADLGLEDMSIEEAADNGAKTMVVGVANRGGILSGAWTDVILQALERGMDVASGLHNKLTDVPAVLAVARKHGRALFDVRHPTREFALGNGKKRGGKRLLTAGTDVSVGKMYTSLAIEAEMRARGMKVDFRATGQTGILIAGDGVSVDAVVADFISGAVEWLAPEAADDHWDVIEGQGSLLHASYAGVTLGLAHGAQADVLVICHEPTRVHMRGLPEFPMPTIRVCMETQLAACRLTNPAVRCIGISINTSGLDEAAAAEYLRTTEAEFGLPTVDPVRGGVARIVDSLS